MSARANKRIIKNTLFLYIRMFLILFVTLYTSRVILQVLGIEDYGIYNVIAGFITVFSFFNSSMSSAAQRFFSFEIGRRDFEKLSKLFNCSLFIHIVIALLIVILTETFGLWFLYYKLVIPENRFYSALFVFHISVVTLVIQTIQIPFTALIQARERMDVYAFISLVEVFLKLLIVYLLLFDFDFSKLKVYSILLLGVVLVTSLCNISYCYLCFKESRFQFISDKVILKELSSYSGWSLFGNIASVAQTQGLNILLNMFFGPLANAAYGIMSQVQNAVSSFSNGFFSAIKPQIIQSYSSSDLQRFKVLVNNGSRYSFILVFLFISPIIYNINFLLKVWLNDVPNHTSAFIVLTLCYLQIESLSYSLMTAVQATGKIKIYQIVIGSLIFLNLPISYFLLSNGFPIFSVFIVLNIISILSFMMRFIFLKKLFNFDVKFYLYNVLFRVILLFLINNLILYYLSKLCATSDFIENIIKILIFGMITLFTSILIGLNRSEKIMVFNYLKNKVKK